MERLPGLVDVVDELFDDGCGISGLDVFWVVGDNSTGRGPDDDRTRFSLASERIKEVSNLFLHGPLIYEMRRTNLQRMLDYARG